MNNEKMLEFVEFVTDKFGSNHEPWKYTRNKGKLKHIRYESDYTGYNHWTKRLKRFFRNATIRHWGKADNLSSRISPASDFTFWGKLRRWPMMIVVHWKVQMNLDNNLPDGVVNGIITHWEEDGEYITMFAPIVGREVLKFLRAEPDNPHAQAILEKMTEAYNEGLNYDKE